MSEVQIQQDKMDAFIKDFNIRQREYTTVIEQLDEYVKDFSEHSDLAYNHLISCLDGLVKEVNENAEFTLVHVKNINITSSDGSFNEDSDLGLVIETSKRYLTEISKYLNSMQASDAKIFNEIKSHISQVDEVKKSIQNVEELSTDIEILAFNAMIVAAKAGSEGLAFSCITDELKNISNQTLLIVNDLMGLEKNLFDQYNLFQGTITEIEKNHKETIDFLDVNLEESFANFIFGIDTIAEIASDLIKHFMKLKPNFNELKKIVELKKEIPESINVIYEAIDAVEKNKENLQSQDEYDLDSVLQLLIGQDKISSYCSSLFYDIKEHLNLSLDLLADKLEVLENYAEDIKGDQLVLQEYFVSDSSVYGDSSINQIFSETQETVNHIVELVSKNLLGKKEISQNGFSLIERIEDLEEQFQFLTKTAKKFNLINISSKIEIAKRKVLSNHGNISDKIEEITEEIGKTLYATYDQLVLIKKSTQHLLNQYNTNMENQEEKTQILLQKIQDSMTKYGGSQQHMLKVFSGINVVSKKFSELMSASQEDINEVSKLTDYADHIADLFKKTHDAIKESKYFLLEISNASENLVRTPHYDRIFRKIDKIENVYKEFAKNNQLQE
jgi:hypothetical protein